MSNRPHRHPPRRRSLGSEQFYRLTDEGVALLRGMLRDPQERLVIADHLRGQGVDPGDPASLEACGSLLAALYAEEVFHR